MKLLNLGLANLLLALLLASSALAQQAVEVVKVISKPVERTVKLPGEFIPYFSVDIHAKVTAFVDKVEVDCGSVAMGANY